MAGDRGAVGGVGRQWPLLAAIVLFLVLFGVVAVESLDLTRGQLTYALDDPYIHMSIARSLAEHGVWGLDGARFASASSSVAWPLVLAAMGIAVTPVRHRTGAAGSRRGRDPIAPRRDRRLVLDLATG